MAHIGKRLQISPFIYMMKVNAVMDFMLEEELHVPTVSPGSTYNIYAYRVNSDGSIDNDDYWHATYSYG